MLPNHWLIDSGLRTSHDPLVLFTSSSCLYLVLSALFILYQTLSGPLEYPEMSVNLLLLWPGELMQTEYVNAAIPYHYSPVSLLLAFHLHK